MLLQEQYDLVQYTVMSPSVSSLGEGNRAGVKDVECSWSWRMQRLQLLSVLYLQRARFIGVGSVSDAALRIKGSWPAGKPFIILDQTFVSLSSSHTSVNFFWTVSLCKWLFQCSLSILAWMALVDLDHYVHLYEINVVGNC